MPEDAKTAFLGRGLHFPIRMNAVGNIELVSGERDIEQSIAIILGTRRGERVMRPNFGCLAHDLLFEPRDAVLIGRLRESVIEALEMWEPRIDVIDVEPQVDPNTDGAIFVTIDYMIKTTHDERSIVYPFFIQAEEEW